MEELFNAYAAFYKTEVPPGGHDEGWDWIFDDGNDFWCDLAEDDSGAVIGFTQYQLMHRSLGGSMVCYLSDLYVEPDISRRLYDTYSPKSDLFFYSVPV